VSDRGNYHQQAQYYADILHHMHHRCASSEALFSFTITCSD
jgi:hypothetical protein